jgi:hypothetical protein
MGGLPTVAPRYRVGGPAVPAVARSVKRSCTLWRMHRAPILAIVPIGIRKKAPPVGGPSQRLIPLDLSLGARAEDNACDGACCLQTGGDSGVFPYV